MRYARKYAEEDTIKKKKKNRKGKTRAWGTGDAYRRRIRERTQRNATRRLRLDVMNATAVDGSGASP